ncbi:MAG: NADH-quinone oxidoreductase subunit A [Elusimicrobia bacterium]|nr:NADH-quinone oxidoreductase subunit A [Elusimicrobiota bacterium]
MMALQYFHILVFALIAAAFFPILLGVAYLARERGVKKDLTAYECGMEPVGSAWVSPNIRFYVFALVFVIFDVEALFVFPWAVQFRTLGVQGFLEVMVFVGVLFLGLVYAWRQGALQWE